VVRSTSSRTSPAFGSGSVLGFWFSFSLIPCSRVLGCGWVEHNDRFMVVREPVWFLGFGTLLGPEETPVGVFSGCSWPGPSNALLVGVVVVVVGWGVVVC